MESKIWITLVHLLTYITDKDHQGMEEKLNIVGVSLTLDGGE
jgi:hypothetical protein